MQLRPLFFFLIIIHAGSLVRAQTCDFLIHSPENPNATTILEPASLPGIKPGDVICLQAGNYHQLLIRDLHGEPGAPIILRNTDGRVLIQNEAHYGISVRNTRHFQILGNGEDDISHGIAVMKVGGGAGISLDQRTSHVSLMHTEVANTLFAGVVAKTDPDCSFYSLREHFVMENVRIGHNYIHDTGMEGIYAGSSFFGGFPLNCNGADTIVFPHLIQGLFVFNNLTERTGRNGIQVNSAVSDCHIFDNKIIYDSHLETHNQMGGIQIGGGSSCDCYNNHISKGKGSGIEVFGQGNIRIFNNLIEGPGLSYRPNEPHSQFPKHGIYLRDTQANAPANILIAHNTIIKPKSDGILFANQQASGSRIHNNIIIDPGSYQQILSAAFIHHPGISLSVSNNLLLNNLEQAGFVNHGEGDYTLKWFSPAVDNGLDMAVFGILFDRFYTPRPLGTGYDIGAHEANPKQMAGEIPFVKAYPNPFKNTLKIQLYLPDQQKIQIKIYSMSGQLVINQDRHMLSAGSYELAVDTTNLTQGMYLFKLIVGSDSQSFRLIRL